MQRLNRLTAILLQLQAKQVVTSQELALHFGISQRTVYRDIRALEEAGVPIGAEAGLGYFIDDSYRLAPIALNSAEAASLLVAEKLIQAFPDQTAKNDFARALSKIRAAMRGEPKQELEALAPLVHVWEREKQAQAQSPFMSSIQRALIDNRLAKIGYQSRDVQSPSTREIEPVALVHYAGHWHLIAWCRLRQDFRDFRTDRISAFELGEILNGKKRRSIEAYLLQQKETAQTPHIIINVPLVSASYMAHSRFWFGFVHEEPASGGLVQMRFLNSDLESFAHWMLSFGPGIQLLQPEELRPLLRDISASLAAFYK